MPELNFKLIPQSTFEELILDAGMLVKNFDPTAPATPADADIITATTGGVNIICKPNFSDLGEDVDNVPLNMLELKHLDSWDCSMATTALGTSPSAIKLALGAADADDTDATHIVPRSKLKTADFSTIWWIGPKAAGGWAAVKLFNALSTEGLSIQTTKNGKATSALTLTGHVSIAAQDVVPMEFWSADAASGVITLNKRTATVAVGDTVSLTATTTPANAVVTWSSLDTDDASVAASGSSPYHAATVTGVSAGTATIQAAITVEGVTSKASCIVTVSSAS